MTKEEAIERLRNESCKSRLYCELYPDACQKEECEIYMAIKALKERPWREYIGKHEAYMIMCDVMDVLYEKEAIKKAVYERLKQAPSIGEWIPCSERLPEREGRYLVTNSVWGSWTVDVCAWIGHWHSDDKPIAWMELPKAWEGEKDG